MTSLRSALDWALIAGFLGSIAGLGVGHLFAGDHGASVRREFREPAAPPDLPRSWEDLAAFPEEYDAWFNDHFVLRRDLVRLHNLLRVELLRVPPHERIALGRDRWMFSGTPEYVANHRGTDLFDEAELERWRRFLDGRREWLEEEGIRYLFLVAPCKSRIYPERMPAHLAPLRDESRLDQLFGLLARETDVSFLDLRPALRGARSWADAAGAELYFPHDTHWNMRGARVAYEALARRLHEWFPAVEPEAPERFSEREVPVRPRESWAWKTFLEDRFPARRPVVEIDGQKLPRRRYRTVEGLRVQVFPTRAVGGPKVLMLHDSFAEALAPFLALQCSELVLLPESTVRQVGPEWSQRVIRAFGPDLVIDERYEHSLMTFDPPSEAWSSPGAGERTSAG